LAPLPDPLLGRGLPGDGPIWARYGDAVLIDVIERFRTHVA
jgi:hypothetical protein